MSSFRRHIMAANIIRPLDIIMTAESNPEVLSVCYAQGWCANSDYMTAREAAAVTDIGTVFRYNGSISHFDEFEYFIGITSIPAYAFSSCSKLTTIKIPDNVSKIGERSFYLDSNLGYISIGSSTTSIGNYAFSNCSKLYKVKFNGKLSALGLGSLRSAYLYWVREFESDNYTVIDGVLYNKSELIAYPLSKSGKIFNTPDFVTSVHASVFEANNAIESLYINEGCTYLGEQAIYTSDSFKIIDLPSTLSRIDNRCLYNLKYLENITCRAMVAPTVSSNYGLQNLGTSTTNTKTLRIPSGATGYDAGRWARLINSEGWITEYI